MQLNNTHRRHCRARERVIMLRHAYIALFFLLRRSNLQIQLVQAYILLVYCSNI